jgi:hypothetical protein
LLACIQAVGQFADYPLVERTRHDTYGHRGARSLCG